MPAAIELAEQKCQQKWMSLQAGLPASGRESRVSGCVRHDRASPGQGENKGGEVLWGDPASSRALSSFLPTLVLHLKDNQIKS